MNESAHYSRVKEFMLRARQDCPVVPTMPSEAVLRLRAKLLLEEALEQINSMGFQVHYAGDGDSITADQSVFQKVAEPDFREILDGIADVSVINTGTMIAMGVKDEELLPLIDENNLAKFGPGHSIREDGKLIKPPGHPKPDFTKIPSLLGKGLFK